MEPAHKASVEDWENMIDTNNKGLVYMTRAVLPGMVERNRGHIINIGSSRRKLAVCGRQRLWCDKSVRPRQFSLNLRTDLHGTAIRASRISSRAWWAVPSSPTCVSKAMTRKQIKPTKMPTR
ncbi:NADP-dependent L-serine/L-allo-threonine dehydrogenase ydfG [Enterobacter cloacae]|uniref:NADP-dependent L-serine/L-allo-threonine dehydrogenase ydfG n=1 Tax=Enterobacter cloacae TaxID=550 RepID=A0A377M1F2_ENTCL|nr:NADP-dependent L-serine/L-allo-threonine dehydrogenase ydfG [Enterobacter cloacae]